MAQTYSDVADLLLPHLVGQLQQGGTVLVAAGGGGGGLVEHDIAGEYHSGTLDESQAPWAVTSATFTSHTNNPDAHHDSATAGAGISITGQQISLADTVAGPALAYNSGVLSVIPGEGLEIEGDAIGLQSTVAGGGLTYAAGVVAVGAGNGVYVDANSVGIQVPGTLDVSSTNDPVSNHKHAVTTSSNPGVAAVILATNEQGSLYLDTDLLYVDAPNNRVGINRSSLAAALDVQVATNADHTLRVKQKSGQTGRLWRVEDSTGNELIVLDSQGNLQSGNPGFVSGLAGWQMSHDGVLEAAHAWIRGEFHASVFSMDEFHSSGGTLFIAPAGKLENDATLTAAGTAAAVNVRTSAFVDQAYLDYRTTSGTGSGTGITSRTIVNYIDVTDPPSGHAMVFSAGDRLRCKSLALGSGLHVYDVWMRVNAVEDLTDYYRYYVQVIDSVFGTTFDLPTLPAGAAIINYRKPGDGLIVLTADQQYAPYWQVVISGEEPWNGDLTPTVRGGRLDGVGLPGVSGIEQYGIVLGTDLSDANAPYFVASNLQLASYRIDSRWNNGINDTAQIAASGAMRLGTNVGQDATTGFRFDPGTGDLRIGSPSYPGSVTVYGTVYLPDGSPVETMRWRGAWASGTAYLKQDAVSYNGRSYIATSAHTAAAGNAPGVGGAPWGLLADQGATGPTGATGATGPQGPAGADNQDFAFLEAALASMAGKPAGLYMVAERVGYWNGTTFTAYIDNAGNFRFGSGTGQAKLEYSASAGKLRGVDSSGNEQWYALASDGALYAGAGSVWQKAGGFGLNAVTGKFTAGTLSWWSGTTRMLSMGTIVDQGAVTGGFIEAISGMSIAYTAASHDFFGPINGNVMNVRSTA